MKSPLSLRSRSFTSGALFVAGCFGLFAISAFADCEAPPANLVGWWRGETNPQDQAGTNQGTLAGNTSYGAGRVGQAFVFDGNGDGVSVGNPPELQLQTFTIEAWVKRSNASVVSQEPWGAAAIFDCTWGGYGFGLFDDGRLFLTKVGYSFVNSALAITGTNEFHHVAVTKTGTNVVFYLDGTGQTAPPYDPGFVFNGPAAIGARGSDFATGFLGLIDEVSLYSRPLAASEIQAIYVAGSAGKCFETIPPFITSQPTNQTVQIGGSATFTVSAGGTDPLTYQWQGNGTNLSGATASSLVVINVQLTNAGSYSVVVSNSGGTATSSNATLTVHGTPPCVASPSGLVSWWRGETNTQDQAGTNQGTLAGNTSYGAGRVGQAFVFDGNGDGVSVGNPPELQLQTFTIEAWVKRSNAAVVSQEPWGSAAIFECTWGGYGFGLFDNGRLFLTKVGYSSVNSALAITGTNDFHHVAVTKTGTNVVFYLNGSGQTAAPYDPGFAFNGPAAIGARGSDFATSFLGAIDEVSVYNRPLAASEIQAIYVAGSAGKCVETIAPFITAQPSNLTVPVGSTATFGVTASGTAPLTYQWQKNGTNLSGATASSLVLINVQLTNAGSYSVVVSNGGGTATSSNGTLTVHVAPPCVASPSGLVGWWRGETNSQDQAGTNQGTLAGNTSYGAGRVGQAFVFNGNGDGVSVGNPPELRLQTFTIETWVKRSNAAVVSQEPWGSAAVFECTWGGYGFGLFDDGRLFLTKVGYSSVNSALAVTGTNGFRHIAVTKTGTNVVFYLDGTAQTATPYDPGFIFNGPAAIGARGSDFATSFLGAIDEVSVYNRSLAASEIQAIYIAGSAGKCVETIPPFITSQPTNQTVQVGGSATFAVTAGGTDPLTYQWQRNGTNLSGATASSLVLFNVQSTNAGSYSVVVSNGGGTATSSNATLTVHAAPPCIASPSGLVSWWPGSGDANDIVGGNNGNFANASFSPGQVGQTFSFDGSGNNVRIPASSTIDVGKGNGLTIEAWVSPADLAQHPIVEWAVNGDYGVHFWANALSPGYLFASIYGTDGLPHVIQSAGSVLNTNVFQHVSVTYDKASGIARLFVNGSIIREANLGSFTPRTSSDLYIGYRPAGSPYGPISFLGRIDEVSIYNRALNAGDVQAIYVAGSAGKCVETIPPFITSQPTNQPVQVGGSATFVVTSGGTHPLAYQWALDGTNIADANTSSLILTNVSSSQAGNYSVVVTNTGGSVTSSNAVLTVIFPPASVRVVSASGPSGGSVLVPVVLAANGNEHALGFSLNFDPALLACGSISLGSGAPGATLLLNTNEIGSGKLGIALALPSEAVFAPGTQEVVQVGFTLAVVTNATSVALGFGDVPIDRQLSGAAGNVLAASFTGGNVAIAAVEFEGDVSPRPGGDRALTVTDWVLAGRYAARLDYPTNAAEFQRADSAPRATLGDGLITVTDWVQAGRYTAKLDPSTPIGGPTSEAATLAALEKGPPAKGGGANLLGRQLVVADSLALQGQPCNVSVRLEAQGDENALGFSLSFDPAALSYTGASLGAGTDGATLFVNGGQAAQGRLGFVLSLGTGSHFTPGSKGIVTVNFLAAGTAAGNYPVGLTQVPVPRQVSDATASALSATYVNGTITVNPLPALKIAQAGQNIALSWPIWATNFVLQQSASGLPHSATWTNLSLTIGVSNNENFVTLPLDAAPKFFRLHQP